MNALLASYRRWQLERLIVKIDREIDGIRAWRIVGYQREQELDQLRAEKARQLQALAYDHLNRRAA
jgi:hypothetical protein